MRKQKSEKFANNKHLQDSKKKNSHGITLVALVVSIVVMLVLAGVSINAVVGDNGIITQAQSATYATSRAVLEEWLNQLYVENYDDFSEYDNKMEAFLNSDYADYFYDPSKDGDTDGTTYGAVSYVVDSDGHALYLIKKSALPDDIKSQITGGEAGEGNYADYLALTDVYGVTSNLKVYYCSAGTSTILGITADELDTDNIERTVKISSNLASILGTDTEVTASSLRSVKTLTIDSSSGLTSLSELYNLTSLQELTLDGVTLSSLSGIQNCSQLTYLCFTNYQTKGSIGDYSALGKTTKLEYLYLTYSNDSQVESVFTAMQNTDYSNLKYLGVYDSTTYVTDISALASLTSTTKQAVKCLYLYNNDITSLTSLLAFINVYELKCYSNANLTTLSGLENMSKLSSLYAYSCNLGDEEVYDTTQDDDGKNEYTDSLVAIRYLSGLKYLSLKDNANLKWIEYISSYSRDYLYLEGCSNLVVQSVKEIITIFNEVSTSQRSIDSKYLSLFNTETVIDYIDYGLTNSSIEFENLYNNSTVLALRLDDNTNLTDNGLTTEQHSLSEVLATCTNLRVLSLRNITGISTIDFVKNMPYLEELDLIGCSNISDLSCLETYCSSLVCLRIDNSDIELKDIQTTISRCNGISNYSFLRRWDYYGLHLGNASLTAKLSTCTNITSLYLIDSTATSDTLDLSSCDQLTSICFLRIKQSIKCPSSLLTITFQRTSCNYVPDLSLCANLTTCSLSPELAVDYLENWIGQLSNCSSLSSLSILRLYDFTISNFSELKNLANLKEIKITTEPGYGYSTTSISGLGSIKSLTLVTLTNLYSLKGISDFNGLTNLQTLYITNASVTDISSLAGLTTLETLVLTGNNITSLKSLENLTSLVTLDLQNNCIYDTSTYTNDVGETITYKNLQILADLYDDGNGALTTLYISGNSGITDYSLITACTGLTTDL